MDKAQGRLHELVVAMVMGLVDREDRVWVRIAGTAPVMVEVRVADGDVGKVVGRDGRMARALRTVLEAAARKHGTRAELSIMERGRQ